MIAEIPSKGEKGLQAIPPLESLDLLAVTPDVQWSRRPRIYSQDGSHPAPELAVSQQRTHQAGFGNGPASQQMTDRPVKGMSEQVDRRLDRSVGRPRPADDRSRPYEQSLLVERGQDAVVQVTSGRRDDR